MADFRVVAIVSAFNEADIISPVIGHLVENGVEVYLIDNHSTDGTAQQARRWLDKGLLAIEEFPAGRTAGEGPPPFDWEAILKRKEELARELPGDWFIHHDADEFREPPWPGMNLRDAIRWVDRLGYNCIDFRVLNFPPLDNGFQPGSEPSRYFTHWEDPVVYDTLQRKCWKAQKAPVSLAASGGHEARFPGRRVFPIRFFMRHYPIRNQEHGHRKVFDERKKRFVEKERAKGWHVQYDSIVNGSHSFLGDPERLHLYDPDKVRLDLMLENEASRAAETKAGELAHLVDARQKDLETAAVLKHEAEKHAANLERDREKLTLHLIERERHIANLETLKAEAERHSGNVETDRAEIVAQLGDREKQIGNLESLVGELRRHAAGLETDRETLARRIAEVEAIRADREARAAGAEARLGELERHAAGLERDRQTLTAHIQHLESVRAEKDRHITMLESARLEGERRAAELAEVRGELEGRRQALQSRVEELTRSSRDLEDRFAAMRTRANNEEGLRREAESRASALAREIHDMRRSTTWRLSAPLRWMADRLKSIFG
jgi:glycosyltransferase involved in cell wall biosynthesis